MLIFELVLGKDYILTNHESFWVNERGQLPWSTLIPMDEEWRLEKNHGSSGEY